MPICEYCGAQTAQDSKFCPNCGKVLSVINSQPVPPQNPSTNQSISQQSMLQQSAMNVPPMGYRAIKKPGLLNLALILNYILGGIMAGLGLLVILVAFFLVNFSLNLFGSNSPSMMQQNPAGGIIIMIFSTIPFIYGILYIILVIRVGEFNNRAKTILLILTGLEIIISILSFLGVITANLGSSSIFSLILLPFPYYFPLFTCILTIYVLVFDQQTKTLFKSMMPIQQPLQTSNQIQ